MELIEKLMLKRAFLTSLLFNVLLVLLRTFNASIQSYIEIHIISTTLSALLVSSIKVF